MPPDAAEILAKIGVGKASSLSIGRSAKDWQLKIHRFDRLEAHPTDFFSRLLRHAVKRLCQCVIAYVTMLIPSG